MRRKLVAARAISLVLMWWVGTTVVACQESAKPTASAGEPQGSTRSVRVYKAGRSQGATHAPRVGAVVGDFVFHVRLLGAIKKIAHFVVLLRRTHRQGAGANTVRTKPAIYFGGGAALPPNRTTSSCLSEAATRRSPSLAAPHVFIWYVAHVDDTLQLVED